MDSTRKVRWRWMAAVASCVFAQAAWAIVLHPGEGEPEAMTDKPADEVIGRWANNASCVAISPNCVITTRHQGGGIGTVVRIAGRDFIVEAIWNHPGSVNPNDSRYQDVDLRVAKLASANLRHHIKLFSGKREVESGNCIVIGGYGLGRGKELRNYGITYGYGWEESALKNLNLRWCTNSIDVTMDDVKTTNLQTGALNNQSFVVADFDDPGATPYEGAVAGHDSGGGWFVRGADGWRLAGLTWGTDRAQYRETLFRSSEDPLIASPERMYALRVSAYSDWIDDVLKSVCTPPEGDTNGDCAADMADLAALAAHWLRSDCAGANGFCAGADIDGDGQVNAADLGRLAAQYSRKSD